MRPESGTATAPACRNCGSVAEGRFCPQCGQETAQHPPSTAEFLHEFVGHYVALEGALWKTLRALLSPGRLTLEYFEGRRRRYVAPLRLYLTASLVFFLAVKIVGPSPPTQVRLGLPYNAANDAQPAVPCKLPVAACETVNRNIQARYGTLNRGQWRGVLGTRALQVFPYAMFLLVPLFALLTRVAYANRGRNYAEHLVFALHLHAWIFFLGALVSPLANLYFLSIGASVYIGLALMRVFGGRRLPALSRYVAILLVYGALVIAAVLAIIFSAAFY